MRLFILVILLGLGQIAFSQDSIKIAVTPPKYSHSLSFSVENGIMLGNGTEFSDQIVNSSYYNGIDFRYGWSKNDPEDTYNRVYRYPTIGIGYYSSTFHNANIGKPNALYFFFVMPVRFEGTKRWTGSYTGAFGLSYNFNPYNEVNNPTNVFIGSYRNCYLNLGFALNYHMSSRLTAFGSVGYKHFSNGSFKQPNYGINLFPLSVGLHYKLSGKTLPVPETAMPAYISHDQFNFMVAVGSKNYVAGDPNYLKITFGLNYLRAFSYKYKMGIGMDLFYSASSDLRNHSLQSDFSRSVSYALVGSWEWSITKVIYVPIGLGYYLHHNIENGEEENYYERVGLRFRLADHYNVGVTIKAHGGSADYFEWTFAYTFHKDPNKYR